MRLDLCEKRSNIIQIWGATLRLWDSFAGKYNNIRKIILYNEKIRIVFYSSRFILYKHGGELQLPPTTLFQ
jgi:hypothetical protein